MNILINSQEYIRPWVKIKRSTRLLCSCYLHLWVRSVYAYLALIFLFFAIILIVKVRTFEEQKSAENNMLPFDGKGALNEISKGAYISSGQATKEVYEAVMVIIRNVLLFIKKTDIVYDSRYFHFVIFGTKGPYRLKIKVLSLYNVPLIRQLHEYSNASA